MLVIIDIILKNLVLFEFNKNIRKFLLKGLETKYFKNKLFKNINKLVFPNAVDLENKITRTLKKTIKSKNFSD